MPEDPFDPDNPPPPAGFEDAPVRIAGAGNIGMAVFLASLSILFIASILGFIIIRSRAETWPPQGFPPIPATLWLSTMVILATSVTIQLAYNAVAKDDDRKLLLFLRITFALGLLFLIVQSLNWLEFYHGLKQGSDTGKFSPGGFYVQTSRAYFGGFYILTALHAAHVLGGLIPLGVVMRFARLGRYSRNFHPGVRYSAIYWHFLDAVWIVLFCVLYF